MNKSNSPYSFKFHFSFSVTDRDEWRQEFKSLKRLKLTQTQTELKYGIFFPEHGRVEVISKHFGHVIYSVFRPTIINLYEMHLVELHCSKSTSL